MIVNRSGKAKPLRVDMTIYQAAIVLLFNDRTNWMLKELTAELRLSEEQVIEALERLVKGKLHLLQADRSQTCSSVFTVPDAVFSLNSGLHSSSKWPLRFSICTDTQTAVERNAISSRREVNEDRQYHVDAAIVRVMKGRRKMLFQDLMAEVIQQLSIYFQPNIKFLKTRIEHLVEYEFLERDTTNPAIYLYRS